MIKFIVGSLSLKVFKEWAPPQFWLRIAWYKADHSPVGRVRHRFLGKPLSGRRGQTRLMALDLRRPLIVIERRIPLINVSLYTEYECGVISSSHVAIFIEDMKKTSASFAFKVGVPPQFVEGDGVKLGAPVLIASPSRRFLTEGLVSVQYERSLSGDIRITRFG